MTLKKVSALWRVSLQIDFTSAYYFEWVWKFLLSPGLPGVLVPIQERKADSFRFNERHSDTVSPKGSDPYSRREMESANIGIGLGYAQANLVILPKKYAFDFLLFCQKNPKPCPLLEVLEPGRHRTEFSSRDVDIRTDLPRYNIYRKGRLEATVREIKNEWRSDFVTFLLGCSFSFEEALLR